MKNYKPKRWCVWFHLFGGPAQPWELEAIFCTDYACYDAKKYIDWLVASGASRTNLALLPEGREPAKARRRR